MTDIPPEIQKARQASRDSVFGQAKITGIRIDDPISGAEYASIGEEYAVPELFWAEVTPLDDAVPRTRMLINSSSGVPACVEIRLRTIDDSGIQPDALRKVQTGAYLREIVAHGASRFSRTAESGGRKVLVDGAEAWITPLEPGERWSSIRKIRSAGNERMRRAKRGVPVTDEQIAQIAEDYLRAVDQSQKAPVATLAKTHNVSVSTIHRWLDRARKKGLLGPATHGKAG